MSSTLLKMYHTFVVKCIGRVGNSFPPMSWILEMNVYGSGRQLVHYTLQCAVDDRYQWTTFGKKAPKKKSNPEMIH